MPVTFSEFSGQGDPRNTLINFVEEVRKFLDDLVQQQSLFRQSLRSDMQAAWQEVEPLFSEIRTRIANLSDADIRNHGLGGRQLRFKLAVIRFFYEQYQRVGTIILKKLIDIIDTLLKSILEAIGGGGAIAEIKDFIKDSLED
jgi:hypothetical protein